VAVVCNERATVSASLVAALTALIGAAELVTPLARSVALGTLLLAAELVAAVELATLLVDAEALLAASLAGLTASSARLPESAVLAALLAESIFCAGAAADVAAELTGAAELLVAAVVGATCVVVVNVAA
jgi:hypothetical protein